MSVEIVLKFGSVAEAAAAIAVLAGGKPASGAGATTSRTADAGAGAASGKESTKADTKKAPKYDETKLPALIKELAKTKRDGVVAIFKEFGVERGADLKAEDYDKATAKLEALKAEAEPDLS